jgi:hypothetical protein
MNILLCVIGFLVIGFIWVARWSLKKANGMGDGGAAFALSFYLSIRLAGALAATDIVLLIMKLCKTL